MALLDEEKVQRVLVDELGYGETLAALAVKAIANLHPDLRPALEHWIEERQESPFIFKGVSISQIMEKERCDYLNALFTMSTLMNKPELVDAYLAVAREGFAAPCGGIKGI